MPRSILGVYFRSPFTNLKPTLCFNLSSFSYITKVTTIITKPTDRSIASKDQSRGEHLSEPMKDGSLPEPRKRDTRIRVGIITKIAICFLGYQFVFSAYIKDSRIEELSDYPTMKSILELFDAWVIDVPLLANGFKLACLFIGLVLGSDHTFAIGESLTETLLGGDSKSTRTSSIMTSQFKEKGLAEFEESSCSLEADPELSPETADVCLTVSKCAVLGLAGIDLQCARGVWTRWTSLASVTCIDSPFMIYF